MRVKKKCSLVIFIRPVLYVRICDGAKTTAKSFLPILH
jgi:hypothetical protein